MTDPAIARSLELQRRGFRVTVEQVGFGSGTVVTVYLGKRDRPISEQVKATGATFAAALRRAAELARVRI